MRALSACCTGATSPWAAINACDGVDRVLEGRPCRTPRSQKRLQDPLPTLVGNEWKRNQLGLLHGRTTAATGTSLSLLKTQASMQKEGSNRLGKKTKVLQGRVPCVCWRRRVGQAQN